MTKHGGIAGQQLRTIIERIERLEEEKAGLAGDIREIYAEAKGNGFDPKTIRHLIRLRRMDTAERDEYEALIDIYKAALGMLGDTPLGEAAIRRLDKDKPAPKPEEKAAEAEAKAQKPDKPAGPPITIEQARAMGKKAAEEGKGVGANPFPARDPRRAAWDEEWCKAAGSDGMDIPDAWRRTPKKKDDENNEPKKD